MAPLKTDTLYWFNLLNRRASRRDFLRVGRDVAGLVMLGALPALKSDAQPRVRGNPFSLGVASGDPSQDGVVLWSRLATDAPEARRQVAVRFEIAEDEGFRRIVKKDSVRAIPELGHSVHAEIRGLHPGRDYWYRFIAGSEASPVGRTRTAPQAGAAVDRFRFAIASCQNYEHGYFTAHRHLAADDLDLVIHLGDYFYEKRFNAPEYPRQHEAGEVITLDQYRARYSLYKTDPDLQACHAAHPWVVTTDDHEVDNNYAGYSPEDDQPPEAFRLRRAAAYQAFYEFMPLRRSSMPAGPAIQLYRRVHFGSLAEFHVLDTRQYRTDQPCGDGRKVLCPHALDPDATMLGKQQEAWLMSGLRASSASWNVLANQVMLAQNIQVQQDGQKTYSMDKWDGYVEARKRLMNLLAEARPSNPIVVTGDIHSNWVADLKQDFDNPSSRVVGTEFVGTSISAGGDGRDTPGNARNDPENPHIKFFNSQRGYVRITLVPGRCTADYLVLPYVTRPGAAIATRASFVVEDRKTGVQPA